MTAIKYFVFCNTGISLFQAVLRCIVALLLIGQIGCVAPPISQSYQEVPILYGIFAEDRSRDFSEYRIATAQEWRRISIMRRGVPLDVTPNMALQIGDSIRTSPSVAAAIGFSNGSQLYLRPNSHVRIGSVFAFVGGLFVRVKGLFKVDTEFVTAGAEGTEWAMIVRPNGDTRCIVLEGRTKMVSSRQRWRPISVTANNQIVTYGADYQQVSSAPLEDIRRIQRWVRQIDRLTQQPQTQPEPQPWSTDNRRSPFDIDFIINLRRDPDTKRNKSDGTDTNSHSYPRPSEYLQPSKDFN